MPRSSLLLLFVMLVSGTGVSADDPLFTGLINQGVTLSDATVIKLPPPSLPDNLDVDAQTNLLKKVADKYPLDLFLRDSRVAPFVLKMNSIKDSKGLRTGQTIDLWFVAYGNLAAIEEHKLMKELGTLEDLKDSSDSYGESRALTKEELTSRIGLICEPTAGVEERYYLFDGLLLNRVRISGVTRTAITRKTQSTLMASVLDERFAEDPEFPNQWRSQRRNNQGEMVFGPPVVYAGFGGYAKATQLHHPSEAILIEIHVAFNEPHGWFDGANLLRSKLPIVVQDNVRSFRTKLRNLSQQDKR